MILWPIIQFKPTHRVIAENDLHEYKVGTLLQYLYASGLTEYGWYADEDGIAQIMDSAEIEKL